MTPTNTVAPYLVLPPRPTFPDRTVQYQQAVAYDQQQAALQAATAACTAQGGTYSASGCYVPPPPPPPVLRQTDSSLIQTSGLLTGVYGYSLWGGNCVDMAKAYGKDQPGNPIEWSPTTQTPFIGAAALFYFNHVAVVVGLWSNGDIEIAQENAGGMAHRWPRSEFRGFF